MALGTGYVPNAPIATSIYRGFLLSPPSGQSMSNIYAISYQFQTSIDGSSWTDWLDFSTVYSWSKFNSIHDGLYTDVYYQYRCKLTFVDKSLSEWSDFCTPGNGIVLSGVDSPVSSIDQLAANLGTFTAGFLRGVVFETSPNYPKVRFDPNGFYAINNNATPVFIDAFTGNITVNGGTITGANISTSNTASQIVMRSDGFYAYDASTPTTPTTPIQFNPTIGQYEFKGHLGAAGVDFIAGSLANPPPNDRRVRWHRQGTGFNGPLVSEIYSQEDTSNGAQTSIRTTGYGGVSGTLLQLFAQDQSNNYSTLNIQSKSGDKNYTKVGVEVDGVIRKIVDGNGTSDFLQAGDVNAIWKLYGLYNAAYSFGAGSGQTIDVAVASGILAGQYLPIFANLGNFAGDRVNAPSYSTLNTSTIRIVLSTDWAGGGPNGTIWFAIMVRQ